MALGDSYSSGPLIPTQVGPGGCARSDHSYPFLVAQALGVHTFRDVTCSGATIADLAGPQNTSPAVPPQFDTVGATATIVTLGVGGDDIGFVDDIKACVSLLPAGTRCQDNLVVNGIDTVRARIDATRPKLVAALRRIHLQAPGARVFVVGYPALVPATGVGCWPQVPISPADTGYVATKTAELNRMLAAAAGGARATYVDIQSPSTGHDACEPPDVRWVEPILPAVPGAPLHPNQTGMAAVAAIVARAVVASS